MKIIRVPIPKTRDPFVNTPLLALGRGKDGLERFWISSYNANVGCMGVVVDENGRGKIYPFNNARHGGFYSAVREDADTLWLCGFLSHVVRLKLSSGKFTVYETGLPNALVFQGMALDKTSGKLFVFAYPPPENQAFSFDIKQKKVCKVYKGICDAHYMRFSFPNGDGAWSIVVNCPGEEILNWKPANEEVSTFACSKNDDSHKQSADGGPWRLISDGHGKWYFPGRGWFNPRSKVFEKSGPRPEREMTWFAKRRQDVFGVTIRKGDACVGKWNLTDGKVRDLCVVPDAQLHSVNITAAGNIVAVNQFGFFYRFNGLTGQLECTRRLDTDSIGHIDCIRRIDSNRLIGTPFITQRFFEVNLRTKKGFDCGRAAPGCGEIMKTWKVGGKIYMGAYTGAELVEYDPAVHPRFPENPRVVAKPIAGMRPIADADDGRNIFYVCSHHYGLLGCVLTKYDTSTGMALYADDPVPGQMIRSMVYDKATDVLLCGTNNRADCQSCPPNSKKSYLVKIRAADLKVVEKVCLPEGVESATVYGWLDKNHLLCEGFRFQENGGARFFRIHKGKIAISDWDGMKPWPKDWGQFHYTGKPGFFVVLIRHGGLELWNMNSGRKTKTIMKKCSAYRMFVDGRSIYLATQKEIIVLENCI